MTQIDNTSQRSEYRFTYDMVPDRKMTLAELWNTALYFCHHELHTVVYVIGEDIDQYIQDHSDIVQWDPEFLQMENPWTRRDDPGTENMTDEPVPDWFFPQMKMMQG